MPYNDRRIVNVLLEAVSELPERADGYRKEFAHVLGEILLLERRHAIARRRIVKELVEKVEVLGGQVHASEMTDPGRRTD